MCFEEKEGKVTSFLGRKKREYQDLAPWPVFALVMHLHVLCVLW